MSDDNAPRVVHPGARCKPVGATGVTKNGTGMVCQINPDSPPKDGWARWGRSEPLQPAKRRRGTPRKRQGLEKRYVDRYVASAPEVDAPLPQQLVDQLDDKQTGALRTAAGMTWKGPKPRKTDLDKLTRTGLLTDDGKLTKRGFDAIDRCGEFKSDPQFSDHAEQQAKLDKQRADLAARFEDRSGDSGTDWSEYSVCPICGADLGNPCHDLRNRDSLNAVPHPQRPKQHSDTLKEIDQRVAGKRAAEEHRLTTDPSAYDLRNHPSRFVGKEITVTAIDAGGQPGKTYTGELVEASPITPVGNRSYTGVQLKGVPGMFWADNTAPVQVHDRSADSATDWSRYGACPTCSAEAGAPCRDLAHEGSLNATAHDGRPLVEQPATPTSAARTPDDWDFSDADIQEMRQRDAAADRRLADELDKANEEGNLTTHDPGQECGHGLWHTGRCAPKDPPYDFEQAGAEDDTARAAAAHVGGAAPTDRSSDSGTDWSQYASCPTCQAGQREPCHDLSSPGSLNATAHDGRPTLNEKLAQAYPWAAPLLQESADSAGQPGAAPDAMVEDIPVWAQRQIDEQAGGNQARAEQLARDFITRQRVVDQGLREASEDDLLTLANDSQLRNLAHAARNELSDRRYKDWQHPTYDGGPLTGSPSASQIGENGWGYNPALPLSYHDDGPIGTAVKYMGPDAQMDIDGIPLGEALGRVATDVVHGRRSSADALETYRTIRDRTPAGSRARQQLDAAISDIDAPMIPVPDVPAETPPPLRRLIGDLYSIPMCRGRWKRDLDRAADIAQRAARGELRSFSLTSELRNLYNSQHESYGDVGKMEFDEAVLRAQGEMEPWERHQRAQRRYAG